MSTVTVRYLLSEQGRKASLKAGGNGQEIQEMNVAHDHPDFGDLLDAARMTPSGAVLDATKFLSEQVGINLVQTRPTAFDAIPEPRDVLTGLRDQIRRFSHEVAAQKEERRQKTQEILTQRRTREDYDSAVVTEDGLQGLVRYTFRKPDWFYGHDHEVAKSPEALSWQAELDVQKEVARQKALEEARTQLEAKKAEREERRLREEEKARLESERRAALGLEEGDFDFPVIQGALTRVPCWESHQRGKNWMAVVVPDPTALGGLRRN